MAALASSAKGLRTASWIALMGSPSVGLACVFSLSTREEPGGRIHGGYRFGSSAARESLAWPLAGGGGGAPAPQARFCIGWVWGRSLASRTAVMRSEEHTS